MASSSPLGDLPPELLRMVIKYAMPHGLSFRFEKYFTPADEEPQWMVLARSIDSEDATFVLIVQRIDPPRPRRRPTYRPTLAVPTYPPPSPPPPPAQHALKNLSVSLQLPRGTLNPFVALSTVNKQFHAEVKGTFPSFPSTLSTPLTHPSHPLRAQPIHPNNRRPTALPHLPLLTPDLRAPRPPAPHPSPTRLAQHPPRPRHQ